MKRALSILLAALLVLCALPAVAEEGPLKAGRYACETDNGFMYLDKEGVGILILLHDGYLYPNGVTWTADTLTIERTEIPFAVTDDVLSFTFEGKALALRYEGPSEAYPMGDQGTQFAGDYAAEDGKRLSLTADGRGVYTDEAGEKPVFWGSFRFYYIGVEGQTDGAGYLFFDSFLTNLNFRDGAAVLRMETGEEIPFQPVEKMTLVSAAYDFSLTLPEGGWTVEETDGGVLISRQKGFIQYTFLSLPLDKAPSAATLDLYADHLWTDCLMNVGVAYDPADVVRGDQEVNGVMGRTLATGWNGETGVALKGNSVLWYWNNRLYVVLCASAENEEAEALALMDEMLRSLRTAGEGALARGNQLPVDREVFEGIRTLSPVPAVTEQVYYGYRMSSDGQTVDVIPYMIELELDPRAFCLVLRSDGTGRLQLMDPDNSGELTWTAETITAEGYTIPYTREGDHILFTIESESIEFAPAAEVEAMIASLTAPETTEPAEPAQPAETTETTETPETTETSETPEATETGTEPAGPAAPTAADVLGSWTLTKTRLMGTEIPADQKSALLSLVFNEDGTVIELVDGAPTELEWSLTEDGKVLVTEAGVERYVLTYDGTALLAIAAEGVEMVFERDV